MVLHGHGRRTRQLRGPPSPHASPEVQLVLVRRYLCNRCKVSSTVAPRETVTRRLYSATAIALALALFGVLGMALYKVRKKVSPWETLGATSAATWCTVPRWTDAVREGRLFKVRRAPDGWTPRQVAARAATTLAARAPLAPGPPDIVAAAFLGAARAA